MTRIGLKLPMHMHIINVIFFGGMVYSLRVTSSKFCHLRVVSGGLDCCVGSVIPRYCSRIDRRCHWFEDEPIRIHVEDLTQPTEPTI